MANDVVDDSQSNEKNLSTSPDKFDDFQEIEAIIFPPDPLNLSMDWQILHEVVRFKLKELVSAQSIKLHPTFLSLVDAEIKWIEGLPFTHDPKFDYHAEAKKLRETIKSLHVIGKYHLIDGILAELNHSVTLNGDLFKSLKKITILTVIALIRINTVSNVIEDKVIEEAIRNIRLFSEDRRSSFAKYISDIPFESQFDDIIESIHEQMKNSVQENSVKRLIANLHQILNRLYSHTAKRENSIFGDREQKDTKLEEISDYYIDNVRINVLSDISWAKGKKKPAAWSEEEQLGNTRHQSTYLITDHKPKIQNLSARAQQVKSVAQSISIRTQALPCSSSTFSRTQIQKVVHVLIQKISDGNIASLQLFLQLLFGMTQAELNSLPASSKQISKKDVGDNICWLILHKDIFYLQRLVKVANSTIHKKLSTLLPSSDVFIKLPLPELLKPILKPTLLVNNFNEETSKVFAEIYKKTGIIITQTQFSNYLVRWLQQTRVDQGVAGILAGKTAKQCAPIAYSFIEADRIITIWQEYMTTLGLPVNIEMSKKAVGSRLYPNSETFIQLIHVYQQYVQSYLRSRKSKRSPANWHNLFIRHCLLILNLSTGARPVTDMYGVRQDYCLHSRLIRISDKEARSVPAGRLIPLTDVAVQQLQYLERHLRHMADQFQYKYPELAIAAKNALTSTGPLLFWVNEPVAIQQSVSYQVESITPTSLANYFDNVLPLPVNWHRHAVRSHLLSKNVSTVLIDAVLGHEDMGHEYTNTMSGASLRELFEIPRVLDDWFSELKLECIEGW